MTETGVDGNRGVCREVADGETGMTAATEGTGQTPEDSGEAVAEEVWAEEAAAMTAIVEVVATTRTEEAVVAAMAPEVVQRAGVTTKVLVEIHGVGTSSHSRIIPSGQARVRVTVTAKARVRATTAGKVTANSSRLSLNKAIASRRRATILKGITTMEMGTTRTIIGTNSIIRVMESGDSNLEPMQLLLHRLVLAQGLHQAQLWVQQVQHTTRISSNGISLGPRMVILPAQAQRQQVLQEHRMVASEKKNDSFRNPSVPA